MSEAFDLLNDIGRDILSFCDRRTLARILLTTRKIRDVINSKFSTTPYLMLRHVASTNGTDWLVKSGNMTTYSLELPTDIIATQKFIRSRQTDLDIRFGYMSFDLPYQTFCHVWRDQKMVIAFCGFYEPFPQEFINAVGTSRELKLYALSELKLLPYLNNFLKAGQFNKIGVYDQNDNENVDLNAEIAADFLFKMRNCGDSNSNVLSTSNVLNICSKYASAAHKSLEAIIAEVKEVSRRSNKIK